MCTAVTYKTKDFYFGRTLDNDFSYIEEVTITPRNFSFTYTNGNTLYNHHAIIGMAYVCENYPLYYDAMNEMGLCMAGLNFVGNAHYNSYAEGFDNIAAFEFIPYILSQCNNLNDAKQHLKKINLTNTAFSADLPPAQLHWIIADATGAITVESTESGLFVYDNPVGVLTNNPPFNEQLFQLNNYMHLSPKSPENRFSPKLNLDIYSHGMGALGLPGDLSSQSRFVRAAFTKMNSVSEESETDSIGQFFHILDSVNQTKGCCYTGNDQYEITVYSSCCNADKGVYYYTTYHNRSISAVDMNKENLDSSGLIRYELIKNEQIKFQN